MKDIFRTINGIAYIWDRAAAHAPNYDYARLRRAGNILREMHGPDAFISVDLNAEDKYGYTGPQLQYVELYSEIHKSLNGGAYGSYVDAKDQGLVENRKILAVKDVRTRRQSIQVDKKIDDKDNLFTYPGGRKVYYPGSSGVAGWDINDRETTIEIIQGIEPQLQRGRNPKTGKNEISNFSDYRTWAKTHGLTKNKWGEYVN